METPTNSLVCILTALLLVYLDMATALWWCIFSFSWYLSAAKEWSTEAIERISFRLHASAWILSSLPLMSALLTENVAFDDTTGLCSLSSYIFTAFQFVSTFLGCFLAILTSFAMKNIRKALLYGGRSPYKLERLILRLAVISVGICVTLVSNLLSEYFVISFYVVLVGVALKCLCAIFASFWVFSTKTFKSWNKLLRPSPCKTLTTVPTKE